MRLSTSSLAFACYSAACRPPSSGGTGGSSPGLHPHPNTRKGSNALKYKNRVAEQKFGSIARSIDRLHGLPDDGFATVTVATGTAKTKGGHFDPNMHAHSSLRPKRGETQLTYNARVARLKANPRGPEIRINNTTGEKEEFTFIHEFGHRTDFVLDPHEKGGGRFVSMNPAKDSPAVRDAFIELFESVKTDHFKSAIASFSRDRPYQRYLSSAVEVWARAYSQWAANKIGGDAKKAFDNSYEIHPKMQWPQDEFDARIGPAVENVLIARGLMQRDN